MVSFMLLPLHPGDRAPTTHWIGGGIGPRAGLDTMEKRKISYPCQKLNPSHPANGLVAVLTELSQLLGLHYDMVLQLMHSLFLTTCVRAHAHS
jgi:hypothetical protein